MKTHSLNTVFCERLRFAQALFALSGVFSLDSAGQTGPAPGRKCTPANLAVDKKSRTVYNVRRLMLDDMLITAYA
jgi:hypothetical protein